MPITKRIETQGFTSGLPIIKFADNKGILGLIRELSGCLPTTRGVDSLISNSIRVLPPSLPPSLSPTAHTSDPRVPSPKRPTPNNTLKGHSQGSQHLIRMLKKKFDVDTPAAAALRARLVCAYLIGYQVGKVRAINHNNYSIHHPLDPSEQKCM